MICIHGGPCTGCMDCIEVDESLRLIGDAPEEGDSEDDT
jgi:hypothetical protein